MSFFKATVIILSTFVLLVFLLAVMDLGAGTEDSAGREYTKLPFRSYLINHQKVIAFELYGLKCVSVSGVGVDCER